MLILTYTLHGTDGLKSPPKDAVKTSCYDAFKNAPSHFFRVELRGLLGEKISVCLVGLEPGTSKSEVQHFNHEAAPEWLKL